MRKITMFFVVGAMVFGLLAVSSAQAVVICEHSGSADPTTEGFTLLDQTTATPEDGPPANWRMVNISGQRGFYTYEPITAADFTDPTGWTMTVEAKLNVARDAYRAHVRADDEAGTRFEFAMFDNDSSTPGIFVMGASENYLLYADPTDGFHVYQCYFDPNETGAEDDTASFYVDGTFAFTKLRSELNGGGDAAQFWFGRGTAWSDTSDQQYAQVRLETGEHIIGPSEDPIPGDANDDGKVNDEDASILAAHWQQTEMGWGDGDFNDDNVVNDADASILAAHWLEGTEGTAPVPEPSAVVLLAFAAVSLLVWRRWN